MPKAVLAHTDIYKKYIYRLFEFGKSNAARCCICISHKDVENFWITKDLIILDPPEFIRTLDT